MPVPRFHVRESRAWVRTSTHTVIGDDEPDYQRFAASGEGLVHRLLRIWLVDPLGEPHFLRAYLGSVTISRACISLRDLRRVFRRAERAVSHSDAPDVAVRAELAQVLRGRMLEAADEGRS